MSIQTFTPIDDRPVLPPSDLEPMLELSEFLQHHSQPAALIGPDGEQVPLPMEVYQLLMTVVSAMGEGKAITLAPVNQQLTTQEAADFLGVSRPTLVKLLTDGLIPFEQPSSGRHRRLRLSDVLAYRDRRREERRQILADLTQESVDDGLFGASADEYRDALRRARQKDN
jgi:excisionase family DNA binding protein